MQILQRFSVTLSSVIIATFVCNSFSFNTIKTQQVSLVSKFTAIYDSLDSR